MNLNQPYTAWELCGNHEWVAKGYVARIVNGSRQYSIVEAGPNGGVILGALRETSAGLSWVRRYVKWNTQMILEESKS